ncbi:helix-turn-helix domain-containing protein [Streptomyces sp. NRRL F-5630]|uniref:helix-turn-helix domain-containing protein n=1 Tax=Streptomyces sp. NRRL F-5630 TaxID=1463864 RepID=UPI003D71E8A0
MVADMKARGTQIRRLREEAGHGLNAFALSVGISPSWLSRIERQQDRTPSPEVLARIAAGLGAPLAGIARHDTRQGDGDEDDRPHADVPGDEPG